MAACVTVAVTVIGMLTVTLPVVRTPLAEIWKAEVLHWIDGALRTEPSESLAVAVYRAVLFLLTLAGPVTVTLWRVGDPDGVGVGVGVGEGVGVAVGEGVGVGEPPGTA